MLLPVPTAPTVGEIARRLNVPLHRVEYVIRSRGILPAAKAGNARLFTDEDVSVIRTELDRIDSTRDTEARSSTRDCEVAE